MKIIVIWNSEVAELDFSPHHGLICMNDVRLLCQSLSAIHVLRISFAILKIMTETCVLACQGRQLW